MCGSRSTDPLPFPEDFAEISHFEIIKQSVVPTVTKVLQGSHLEMILHAFSLFISVTHLTQHCHISGIIHVMDNEKGSQHFTSQMGEVRAVQRLDL